MKSNVLQDTHSLVQSLNTSEKGYFKKSLTKRSDGKLEKVFDILNKRKIFNDEALKKELLEVYTHPTDPCKQLTQAVMRSLVQFNTFKLASAELSNLMVQIEIAHNKKLFGLCERLVNQGLDVAEENNLFFYKYLLWDWKWRLPANKLKDISVGETAYKEMVATTDIQLKYAHLIYLGHKLNTHRVWNKITRESRKAFYDEVLNKELANPATYGVNSYLSEKAQALIAGANFVYGNWEKALEGMRILTDKTEPIENLSERQYRVWLVDMGNRLSMCYLLNKRTEFIACRARILKSCEIRGISLEELPAGNLPIHDAMHDLNEGKLDELLEKLKEMWESKRLNSTSKYFKKYAIQMMMICVYVSKNNYSVAIAECNNFLTNKEFMQDPQREYTVRWVELFCAYMMHDYSLFSAKHLAMKRYLAKINTGFDWEQDILSALKNTFKEREEVRKKAFAKVNAKMNIPQNKFEARAILRDFELLMWIEAFANGKNYGEFSTEKYMGS